MIHNKKQLSKAKESIEILQKKIDVLNNSQEIFDVWQVHAWKCRIEDLTKEIEEFQLSKNVPELVELF